jgi:ribosomal protein S18 acetylase RimI-like enzyme
LRARAKNNPRAVRSLDLTRGTVIRRLSPADVPAFRRLRLQALRESPTAFGSSYGQESRRPLAAFKKLLAVTPDNWAFGSLQGAQLIGVLRLVREQAKKERHKATIYGVYVAPSARRSGIARELLAKALATGRALKGLRQIRIGVVTSNAAATALYVKAGFLEYGKEEEALFVAGRFHAESLMVKKLRSSRAGKAEARVSR